MSLPCHGGGEISKLCKMLDMIGGYTVHHPDVKIKLYCLDVRLWKK